MSLRVFNTLSGKKEEFIPIRPGKVGMYVCGVTVYDYCHVGHARAASVFDTIYRYLRYLGYEVTYVRNFTDIDDKIINKANEEGTSWETITARYIKAFYEDMGVLNIESPTEEPKATDHLKEMIAMISKLIENGKAYELDGDVYYAIKTFPEYGKLSGKKIEDLMAGARVEVDERKRDPLDFALWKKSKPGEPAWDSPWGPGRPGWHIECSCMSQKYLGEFFDIHGGGRDLVFPHHENEVAQSQGATGHPPVKYWIHNGFVNINKEKMSKSLGNFFTLRDMYKKYHPEVLRFFLLSNHYRGPIDFSTQNLDEAEKVLTRFYEFLDAAEEIHAVGTDPPVSGNREKIRAHPLMKKFEEAMNDDFNTAVVLGHLNEELRHLNKALGSLRSSTDPQALEAFHTGVAALKEAGGILGLFYMKPGDFKNLRLNKKIAELSLDPAKIESIIAERNKARAAKDWKKADECRDELAELNVVLEDTATGTVWKVK